MWVTGQDFKEVLKSVSEYLQLGVLPTPAMRRTVIRQDLPDDDVEKSRQALNRVWNESIDLAHRDAEPARLYLARRGIAIRQPETLRLHPSLAYFEERKEVGTFPVMLAMVHGPEGDAITIHRTYLTHGWTQGACRVSEEVDAFPQAAKADRGRDTAGGAR